AGDSLLDAAAAAGVQAYVTADLRHHPADEHRRRSEMGLVDVAHWASEYPWCEQAAGLLRSHFGPALPVSVCPVRTDPWNLGQQNTAQQNTAHHNIEHDTERR
ncbi:MAG: Nif3-like dinuclear metal center hexameric protein, partial [Mycobacterium sp.]|nr:Nif3-like dinuclear metal center hexameric protein [Mycobacterium sp.]